MISVITKPPDTTINKINIHGQGGVTHNCDQCECQVSTKNNLITHKLIKYEGVTFECDQCD